MRLERRPLNEEEEITQYLNSSNDVMAEKLVRALLQKEPHSAFGNYTLAKILWNKKCFGLAIDKLNYILRQLGNQLQDQGSFLVMQLLALCYYGTGEHKKASDYFFKASQLADNLVDRARMYSNYLFLSNYSEEISDGDLSQIHKNYGEIFKNINKYDDYEKVNLPKLRIGYISPDFRQHVVVYFSYPLLAKYNRNRYEVYCYAKGPTDQVTEQLKNFVDKWEDITCLSDEEAARRIHDDKIDILFDLSGHSANNCLPILARRPAPIQICGIGYFNTTGLATVDYFLTDVYCDSPGKHDELFTEKLLRLPHSHFCYTPPDTAAAVALKRREIKAVVFASFNNFSKITDMMLNLWLQILQQVPNSKLLLKSPYFDKRRDQAEIYSRAKRIGFSDEQLEIRAASIDYLKEYNEVDIALDTFPYPGGGTTCEALYMGTPVVTLKGTRHGSCFGYSIMENIGLPELSANNMVQYVEIAVVLAKDKELLRHLHNNLRSLMQKSKLMDQESYVRDVEQTYEEIWAKWLNQVD